MSKSRKKPAQVKPAQEVAMTTDVATLDNLETEVDRVRMELETAKRELEAKRAEMKALSTNSPAVIDKGVTTFTKDEGLKDKIARQKEYDCVMVTGRFMNRRAPGQTAKLTYMKYDTDPVKWYEFRDGQVYTIPRGFVDQINEHYHTPVFIQSNEILDPNNPKSTIADVDTTNKKYAFVATDFDRVDHKQKMIA